MASASEILSTYSPEDVYVVLANGAFSYTLTGFMDGTFINISREVPASTLYVGGALSNARTIRANKASSVTFSLMQTSDDNDILSQLLSNDEVARDNTWLFSLTIKDGTGRSLWYSPQAFIGTEPDRSLSTGVETRDWVIQCVSLTGKAGGNGKFTPDSAGALTALGGTVEPKWAP